MTDFVNREHSIWGPSGFDRWSRCPGSALLTADMESTSEAAERGTTMHKRAELIIKKRLAELWQDSAETRRAALQALEDFDKESPLSSEDCLITTNAVECVMEIIRNCGVMNYPEVYIERRVDCERLGLEEVFGTADVIVFDSELKEVHVVDFKFGSGFVPADAGQLLMYARMALLFLDVGEKSVDKVFTYVVQPAKAPVVTAIDKYVSRHEMLFSELLEWWGTAVLPALDAAMAEDAELTPGEQQCKFCPAKGSCPARRDQYVNAFEPYAKEIPGTIPTDELDLLLSKLTDIESFKKAVEKELLKRTADGAELVHNKVVRSTKHLQWTNEEKADKWLAGRGIKKEDRTVVKLISPTQAEKLIYDQLENSARLRGTWADKITTRPEGELKLAPRTSTKSEVVLHDPLADNMEI